MGNNHTKTESTVQNSLATIKSSMFGNRSLRLAPTNTCEDGIECPICFVGFREVNQVSCCSQPICTECFIQLKENKRTGNCPFCYQTQFEVLYTPNSNPDCNSKHSSDISVAKSSAATVQLSQLPANATSRGNLNSNDNEVIPVKSAANIVVPTCSVADRHQLEQELQKQQCLSYPKYRDSIGRYGGTRSGGSRQWQWQEHGSQLDNMRFEAYLMSRSHEDSVPRAWDSNANESVAEDGEQNAVRTGEDGPGRGSTSSRERAVDIDAQELLDFGDAATLEDIMLMEAIQLSMQLHAGNSSDAGEEEH